MRRPLRSGLRVEAIGIAEDLPGLLQLSSGCEQSAVGGRAVFVPRNDWRSPTPDELAMLQSTTEDKTDCAVGLLRFDPDLIATVRARLWSTNGAGGEPSGQPSDGDIDISVEEVTTEVARRHGLERSPSVHVGLISNRPDLQSTAFDAERGHPVGLHLDSHRGLPIAASGRPLRLLSLNLGRAERYLDFINLDGEQTLAASGLSRPGGTSPSNDDVPVILAALSDYPVTRLTVPSGAAYLCDTEAVIHDGATNSEGEMDLVLQLLAAWREPR